MVKVCLQLNQGVRRTEQVILHAERLPKGDLVFPTRRK